MGAALEIRTDLASPARLRRLARRERSPRTASRMLAIAGALEGMSRAEAVRLGGWSGRHCETRWSATMPRGYVTGPRQGEPRR
jgi:hypothetical protein